jgi:hypothetical protein
MHTWITNKKKKKNKKLAQQWIGPYLVTKVINEQNVELQILPKKIQIHSAYRLKKFVDPKTSKFLNEERKKEKVQRINLQNFIQASKHKTRRMLRTRKLN